MIELLMAIERLQFSKSEVREFECFYLRGEASLRAGQEMAILHIFFHKVQKFLGAEDTVLSTSTVTKFLGAEDQMFLCPQK